MIISPVEKTAPIHIPIAHGTLPNGWLWSRLDDVSKGVFDCPHSTPKLTDVGPFVVRTQDTITGIFRKEKAGRVSEETYAERISRVTPTYGDLLYSREGTYFGIAAEVPPKTLVCLGQRMVLIRPDDTRLHFSFLRYWLNSPIMAAHIHGYRDGTVAERLNLPTIRALPVLVPPLSEQRAIASVLGALDDKIELNRRMNATLEGMARALFQSWFVDFDPVRAKLDVMSPSPQPSPIGRGRSEAGGEGLIGMDAETAALFPSEFEESELGLIPKGWEVGKIGDCCIHIQNGGTPRRDEPRFWNNGAIPWLASGEVRQAVITTTESFITEEGLTESSAKWVPEFSTVVALYGATAGQVSFTSFRLTTNQAVCALIPKKHFAFFNYLTMRGATADLENKAVGSAQQNISKGIVEETEVILPPTALIERFTRAASPLFERWISNLQQSRTLATLRDTLLPKLLSGELRVEEAEEALGAER
jgi:type I restriction enzyme S subunit